MDLKEYIRTVPDFPTPGIQFRDITSLLGNQQAFAFVCQALYDRYRMQPVDKVAAIESRGFIFGATLADRLALPLVPIRKEGKLPHRTLKQEYSLEYGQSAVEIHDDAIAKGERVVMIDDLLATGGTLLAANKLVEMLGGSILECAVVIELPDLAGRDRLDQYQVFSMVSFSGD